VPREDQPRLLSDIFEWLRPGGRFLATWPVNEWEGEEPDWNQWGSPMWWSHYDAEQNLRMLRAAGFLISSERKVMTGGETWLWVLATRPL
jgi:hypothetical protein